MDANDHTAKLPSATSSQNQEMWEQLQDALEAARRLQSAPHVSICEAHKSAVLAGFWCSLRVECTSHPLQCSELLWTHLAVRGCRRSAIYFLTARIPPGPQKIDQKWPELAAPDPPRTAQRSNLELRIINANQTAATCYSE